MIFRQVHPDIEPEEDILSASERIYVAVYLERYKDTASILFRWMPQANFERRTI